MKYSYWVSYQFKLPDGRDGFGALNIVTSTPLRAGMMLSVQGEIRRALSQPSASIVIMAISKFES
jgi:hypothetical protein